jgi:hypothetical protein
MSSYFLFDSKRVIQIYLGLLSTKICTHILPVSHLMEINLTNFQSIVGDKTIAFLLMDKEMYSGMSDLQPASPTIDRGIALQKVLFLKNIKRFYMILERVPSPLIYFAYCFKHSR